MTRDPLLSIADKEQELGRKVIKAQAQAGDAVLAKKKELEKELEELPGRLAGEIEEIERTAEREAKVREKDLLAKQKKDLAKLNKIDKDRINKLAEQIWPRLM